MTARVATASETVACERATISAGTSARELMERAGRLAAEEIVRRFHFTLPGGVTVFTGSGNNGGDGLADGHVRLVARGRRRLAPVATSV